MRENTKEKESPLASRLRPTKLEEVVGQQHIIGKDKLLYRAIRADKLSSIIFYGPSGTGKTTLAKVIANTTSAEFMQMNATIAGKKDMEAVIEQAKNNLGMYGKRTILFIDEIHRFNKGQQDYLLPYVEDGTLILIGATTENPYFEVNGALLSRSKIFELRPLEKEAVKELIRYGFEELGLKRIWYAYFDGNEKSKRVAEKCGFRYHHTNRDLEWKLLNKTVTEHVYVLEKNRRNDEI